jgi:TRAP-type C4-dicarboxylate transport system substrate-binding protein
MRPTIISPAALATTIVLASSLAACGGSGHLNKSGATSSQKVTFSVAMPDRDDALGTAFIKAVERRSGGSVQLQAARREYSSIDPANEAALARDLQRGRVDVGYLPARAWASAGVTTFKALLAPFVITTDAAAQKLARSPIASHLLAALPKRVVGLGLVPAETRRVLAKRPPLEPADYAGLRLRIIDNAQTAADFSALGAKPVQGLRSDQLVAALRDHRVDAAETAPSSVLGNGYQTYLHNLSGYGVFPKFQSIVISRDAWERLSAAQQSALRAAAHETVSAAASSVADQERSDLKQLCAARVRIAVPTSAQLRDLARAARPAVASLRADAATARVLDRMQALPGAGPRPLAAPLSGACTSAAKPATHRGPAKIPNGTYVVKITVAEFQSVGAVGPDFQKDVTFTSMFKDGHFVNTQRPTYPDQCADRPSRSHPACVGTYDIKGDEVTFTWSPPTPPPLPAPETVKWSYFNGELHFQPVNVADAVSRLNYAHPWRKVR